MGLEMLTKTAAAAAFIGVMLGASMASAFNPPASTEVQPGASAFQKEYGVTLPPIGFVKFCSEQPLSCAVDRTKDSNTLVMTSARWQLVHEINAYVNQKIAPVSDQELYGQSEYWTYPVDAGDCEDYALLKQRYLTHMGLPESALLITVVLDERKDGHAVLTLKTTDGDFVLDNRLDEVRPWNVTKYTYLKRQSPQDPRRWVALVQQKPKAQTSVASQR